MYARLAQEPATGYKERTSGGQAKLVPADTSSDDFIGRLEGVVKIVGDIASPVEPPERWKALRWLGGLLGKLTLKAES